MTFQEITRKMKTISFRLVVIPLGNRIEHVVAYRTAPDSLWSINTGHEKNQLFSHDQLGALAKLGAATNFKLLEEFGPETPVSARSNATTEELVDALYSVHQHAKKAAVSNYYDDRAILGQITPP